MSLEQDIITAVNAKHGVKLQQRAESEWTSHCPFCGDGGKGAASDRFHVWTDYPPRYWCRQCNAKGKLLETLTNAGIGDNEMAELSRLTVAERAARHAHAQQQMEQCTDHLIYYNNLLKEPNTIQYWQEAGITMESVHWFKLGYCHACPMDFEHRPSYTIPIFYQNKLVDIRHRIVGAEQGDKYRPHIKHIAPHLFNGDIISTARRGLLLEGEKKCIVATQMRLDAVGQIGKTGLDVSLVLLLEPWDRVYVVYDPDAIAQAEEAAHRIGKKALVVDFPGKFDDLVLAGMSRADILRALTQARRFK